LQVLRKTRAALLHALDKSELHIFYEHSGYIYKRYCPK